MPVEIQKIMPALPSSPDHPSERARAIWPRGNRGSTPSTTAPGIDCETACVRAYTVITRATCIFSTSRRLCIPARNVISSRYNAPAGTIPFHPVAPTRTDSRARIPTLRREALDIFIFVQTDIFFGASVPICLAARHTRRCEFSVRAMYRLLALHDTHCIYAVT